MALQVLIKAIGDFLEAGYALKSLSIKGRIRYNARQILKNKLFMLKLFIITYGCQMNVYDSEKMAVLLKPHGYELTEQVGEANLVILNTCNIREKAAEKVYSELGRIKPYQQDKRAAGQPMNIVVAGCVGQAEGEEVFRRAPFVDIVVGPQSYATLPELLARIHRGEKHAIDLDFPQEAKFDNLPDEDKDNGAYSRFLTIQEGCDKFCTFCCVPYTRGAEFSRPVADIYREAVSLVAKGAREITLLGQNVNAYHGASPEGETNLAALIKQLAKIEGLKRLRYTTSHPKDMDQELVAAHGEIEALMPYLHLPVQSGSNRILKAMNRHHTIEDYHQIIQKLREARPDIMLSSDFIVGFPGETEDDFAATMELVEKVKFGQSYSFKYSPRPGTPAAAMEVQVPEKVKDKRLAQLQALLLQQQDEFNHETVGKVLSVLFERPGRHSGQLAGRSPYLQPVHVEASQDLLGEIVPVLITEVRGNSLIGRVTG